METAGRELSDEAEREAMKDAGIGTPATRAAIIETLFAREYVRREKSRLYPRTRDWPCMPWSGTRRSPMSP